MGLRQDDPASSSHSLHSLDDAPPPYTDDPELILDPVQPIQNAHLVQSVQPPASIRPLRLIDSAYILPGGTDIRPHDKVAVTLAPALSRECDELYDAIRKQINLPPRPLLNIRGSHTESNNGSKKEKNNSTVTDFQFKLDLAETMLTGWEGGSMDVNWMEVEILTDEDHKPAYRGGILRSRAYKAPKLGAIHLNEDGDALLGRDAGDNEQNNISPAAKSLQLWCERFCHDPAPVKSYARSYSFTPKSNMSS